MKTTMKFIFAIILTVGFYQLSAQSDQGLGNLSDNIPITVDQAFGFGHIRVVAPTTTSDNTNPTPDDTNPDLPPTDDNTATGEDITSLGGTGIEAPSGQIYFRLPEVTGSDVTITRLSDGIIRITYNTGVTVRISADGLTKVTNIPTRAGGVQTITTTVDEANNQIVIKVSTTEGGITTDSEPRTIAMNQ